jgi:ketosteroid isomerase-like protein
MEPGPSDAITATRASFVDALRNGDAGAAAALYTEKAKLLAPSADLMLGRQAIEAFWRAGIDAGISEIEIEALEVAGDEQFRYEIGRYALRLHPAEGGTVVDRGKYVLVHALQPDGSWLRAVEMFNPDTPAMRADEGAAGATGLQQR